MRNMHRYELVKIAQAAAALADACGWDLELAQRVLDGLDAVAQIPVVEEGRCPRCEPLVSLVRELLEAVKFYEDYLSTTDKIPVVLERLRARVEKASRALALEVES